MRIPKESLVLVADGRKMLLLRNEGLADKPQLTVEYGEEEQHPSTSDITTDQRGRRPAGGSGQDSMGETDHHQLAEDDFARHIAEKLNGMALRNELDPIVIVASAKTLGMLRKQLHKEAQAKVIGEVEKVLTGYSTDRIADALASLEEPA